MIKFEPQNILAVFVFRLVQTDYSDTSYYLRNINTNAI